MATLPVGKEPLQEHSPTPLQEKTHHQIIDGPNRPKLNTSGATITPIAALKLYTFKWTIQGRVTSKGELTHFTNSAGPGKVFSFELLDSTGGEIRVTCFNLAADKFYDVIQKGKVFSFSNGRLKPADRRFDHLKHNLEIILEPSSIIHTWNEDDNNIPQQNFHFSSITEIVNMETESFVDVIGVVDSVSPCGSIIRHNGCATQKQSLQLIDDYAERIQLTLWGKFCNEEGQTLRKKWISGELTVLIVKHARVTCFNSKALETVFGSSLLIQPDIQEAERVKSWFQQQAGAANTSVRSELPRSGTIRTLQEMKKGNAQHPRWITVAAKIVVMDLHTPFYLACPKLLGSRQCSKKLTENGEGSWMCARCGINIDESVFKYKLRLTLGDGTGEETVTAFECAEQILGVSAKQLSLLKEQDKLADIAATVVQKDYIFKFKVKEETFKGKKNIEFIVEEVDHVDFQSTCEETMQGDTSSHVIKNTFLSIACTACGVSGHSSDICSSFIDGDSQSAGEYDRVPAKRVRLG